MLQPISNSSCANPRRHKKSKRKEKNKMEIRWNASTFTDIFWHIHLLQDIVTYLNGYDLYIKVILFQIKKCRRSGFGKNVATSNNLYIHSSCIGFCEAVLYYIHYEATQDISSEITQKFNIDIETSSNAAIWSYGETSYAWNYDILGNQFCKDKNQPHAHLQLLRSSRCSDSVI